MVTRAIAGRVRDALVAGLMTVAAMVGAGCEARPAGPDVPRWEEYIRVMDVALGRGDFYAADTARQEALGLAVGTRRWDALVAVGDAFVRFAEEYPRVRPQVRSEAQRIYRTAILRAQQQGSFEGVLRVSEAFADLGDRDAAREGLTLATALLDVGGPHDAKRLRALAERLDYPTVSAGFVDQAAGEATAWTR